MRRINQKGGRTQTRSQKKQFEKIIFEDEEEPITYNNPVFVDDGLINYGVKLTDGQKEKLAHAVKKRCQITLRLKNNQLKGRDGLALKEHQVKRIENAISKGTGLGFKNTPITNKKSSSIWRTLVKFI